MRDKTFLFTLILSITYFGLITLGIGTKTAAAGTRTFNAELEYLKSINSSGTVEEPQLIYLLAAQYMNINHHLDGIEFFEKIIDENADNFSPTKRALYLGALGLMRGAVANQIPFLNRIGWVNETISTLETARLLSGNDLFLVRWSTGIVYAQLPAIFQKRDTAFNDLNWCIENISIAPHYGWLRELYYHLGFIFDKEDDQGKAQEYLDLSGYKDFEKKIILTTSNSTNGKKGSTFHPKRLLQVIPDKVFALTGFEFTEFYFIVTDDGNELIAIDTGTRPDSAQEAYEHLIDQFPDLPQLTTIFITHSHWDHIGGYKFFKGLNPDITVYARENFHTEVERDINVPVNFDYFFGSDFKIEFLADFAPDILIDDNREIEIGGTLFRTLPISGGETEDGMLIYLPENSVLFTGDFIMPYIGAPFLEEGNIHGLFQSIDIIVDLNPNHILHGHEGLTRIFNSPALLANLKLNLEWLNGQVLNGVRGGEARPTLHQKNLIPPFINETPEVHLPYLVLRENFINRIYDQNVGYWQPDLKGMDYLSQREIASAFTDYLAVTEKQLADAIKSMVKSGDHELAGWLSIISLAQFPESEKLKKEKVSSFLKLKEKYQEFNPFKFVIYSEVIDNETPQLAKSGMVLE